MKILTTTFLIWFFVLPSNAVLGETVKIDELVKQNGLYYKIHTETPFTGKVIGNWNGEVKNGKKNGIWKTYWSNGQLEYKGHYKDGKEDGLWETYWKSGQLGSKGHYKEGKRDGLWKHYYKNGQLWFKAHYKDGKIITPKIKKLEKAQ